MKKFMTIRYELLEGGKAPFKATKGAAGYDLTVNSIELLGYKKIKYYLGVKVAIPEGHVGLIFPRSSVHKTGLRLSNAVGVIDSDYRGEIGVVMFNHGEEELKINIGDRIAQLIFEKISTPKIVEVTELPETKRGENGYGSTGGISSLKQHSTNS